MPTIRLDDRALIAVTGAEAESFLQNIITTDLDALREGQAKPGALLTPQGKILFDFLVSRIEGGLRLDVRADVAEDLVKRLTLYRMRAKVAFAPQVPAEVAVRWGEDASSDAGTPDFVLDTRFPEDAAVVRLYGSAEADAPIDAWHQQRILHGVAESSSDYSLGDAFPHDVLLDQNGGVGLRKGCYVGQEVVSRMQHRGTARRRVLLVNGDVPLPDAGTAVLANGRPIGTLGSVAGHSGIAILRIDRVKSAMDAGIPLIAGNASLTATIPSWAGFGFPEGATGADAD